MLENHLIRKLSKIMGSNIDQEGNTASYVILVGDLRFFVAVEGLAKVFWEVLTARARAKPLARSEGNFAARTRCCLPEMVAAMKHVALILTSVSSYQSSIQLIQY